MHLLLETPKSIEMEGKHVQLKTFTPSEHVLLARSSVTEVKKTRKVLTKIQ